MLTVDNAAPNAATHAGGSATALTELHSNKLKTEKHWKTLLVHKWDNKNSSLPNKDEFKTDINILYASKLWPLS